MTEPTTVDPIMIAITDAVTDGRGGNADLARHTLLTLWDEIGATGDAFHRCTLAHYLADLYNDPARSLAWDVRALDAADAVTDRRAGEHHAGLLVAAFYPSLHLNLADNYRRLGSFEAADEHIAAARQYCSALHQDSYGDLVRKGIDEVSTAVSRHDTAPLASAPGPTD